MRFRAAAPIAIAVLCCGSPAPAAPGDTEHAFGESTTSRVEPEIDSPTAGDADGVYGRFGGDLELGLAAGTEFTDDATLAAFGFQAHYFATAGLYTLYADDLGADRSVTRRLSFGVDLRPSFIPRWAQGMQGGPGFVDLFVDSIALNAGAYFAQPQRAEFGDQRGFEAGLGFGLPLSGSAAGFWLEARGTLRWADSLGDAEPAALLALAWHGFVLTPVARNAP